MGSSESCDKRGILLYRRVKFKRKKIFIKLDLKVKDLLAKHNKTDFSKVYKQLELKRTEF